MAAATGGYAQQQQRDADVRRLQRSDAALAHVQGAGAGEGAGAGAGASVGAGAVAKPRWKPRTAASRKRAAEHAATRAKQAKVRRVHGVRQSHGFSKTGWVGLSCGYMPQQMFPRHSAANREIKVLMRLLGKQHARTWQVTRELREARKQIGNMESVCLRLCLRPRAAYACACSRARARATQERARAPNPTKQASKKTNPTPK